ncbi:MAG: pilus assembly protein [Gemmataceae bacterium]|nr:pilus assembly protein [Gemmataceae bacterium]
MLHRVLRLLRTGAFYGAMSGVVYALMMWCGFTFLVRVDWAQGSESVLFGMLVRCALVGAAIGMPVVLLFGFRSAKRSSDKTGSLVLSSPSAALPRRKGSALVEFAVLAPFMAAIFMGAVDLSRAYYYSTTIDNCCWNGAMWGAGVFAKPNWNASGQGTTTSMQQAALVDGSSLTPPLTTSDILIATNNTTDAQGNKVSILKISYSFRTIGFYPGLSDPIAIVRTAQVRCRNN